MISLSHLIGLKTWPHKRREPSLLFKIKNKNTFFKISSHLQDLEIKAVSKNFNYSNEIILSKNRTLIIDCNRTESFSFEIRFIYCNRRIDFQLLSSLNFSLKDKSIILKINDYKDFNSQDIKTKHLKSFVYIVMGIFFSLVFFCLISYMIGKRLNQRDLFFETNKLLYKPEDFLDINILIKKNELFKKDPIKAGKFKVKIFRKLEFKDFKTFKILKRKNLYFSKI